MGRAVLGFSSAFPPPYGLSYGLVAAVFAVFYSFSPLPIPLVQFSSYLFDERLNPSLWIGTEFSKHLLVPRGLTLASSIKWMY